MSRGTDIKLPKLLLEKAEQVNPSKRPKPLEFANHSDPDYRHPFQIDNARNVLFMGSGEQFALRTDATMNEVFRRILRFGDTTAWEWQKKHIRERVANFFGDTIYKDRPALLWTGQYCITYWYGLEKLSGPVEDNLVQTKFFPGGSMIGLGDLAHLPKTPEERAAALAFDEKRVLSPGTEDRREDVNGNGTIPKGGYDLRLMPALEDVGGIPAEGKRLIIVAAVKDVLHFRIFRGDGRMVVDTDETELPTQAGPIEELRKQLESLWRRDQLSKREKAPVMVAVVSISDHIPMGYLDEPPGISKEQVAALSFDARRLLFAHPEDSESDRRILLSRSFRGRPTPRKTRLRARRESIGVVIPGEPSDMAWVHQGLNPAYSGLVERDGAGRPIFANACYMLAMRLRPSADGDAWAEDLLLVFDSRDSRLMEISARLYDFETFTSHNDEHFAAILRDYARNRMTPRTG
jgi:hypothetical protein